MQVKLKELNDNLISLVVEKDNYDRDVHLIPLKSILTIGYSTYILSGDSYASISIALKEREKSVYVTSSRYSKEPSMEDMKELYTQLQDILTKYYSKEVYKR